MTQEQCRNVAAGFIHALKNSALLAEWNAVDSCDAERRGAIVQRVMGLPSIPTPEQLRSMDAYFQHDTKSKVEAFLQSLRLQLADNPPLFCFLQQQNGAGLQERALVLA